MNIVLLIHNLIDFGIRRQVMETKSKIAKHYTKINIREQKSDFAYWQTQSYQARLAALEEIRQEYHRWRYNVEPKFQRVYRIIKL